MLHDTTVKARALVDAIKHVARINGTILAVVQTDIDPQSGKVERYLLIYDGNTPWVVKPEDR